MRQRVEPCGWGILVLVVGDVVEGREQQYAANHKGCCGGGLDNPIVDGTTFDWAAHWVVAIEGISTTRIKEADACTDGFSIEFD